MPAISANQLGLQTIGDSCKEPKVISVPLDFSLNTQFTLNLQQVQDSGAFDTVLAMYVDNSANGAALDVLFGGTLQTLSWPKNSQGYLPVLAGASPTTITFSTSGGVLVNAFLCNFDIPPLIWVP
jgi:hypothetical protein